MLRPTCVRSAVLGGQVVSEVKGSGVAERGYLYLGAARLARIGASGGVKFEHRDPASTSIRKSDSTGSQTSRVELDPLGVQTGLSGSEVLPPPVADPFAGEHYGNAANPDSGCYVDGVSVPCGLAIGLLQSGAGVGAPGALSGWRRNPQTGRDEWLVFRAFADGAAGYYVWEAGRYVDDAAAPTTSADGTIKLAVTYQEGHWRRVAAAQQPYAINVQYLGDDTYKSVTSRRPWIEGIFYGFVALPKCVEAFAALGIDLKALLANGLVIGPRFFLSQQAGYTANQLGLTQNSFDKGIQQVSDYRPEALTLPQYYHTPQNIGPNTTDSRARIFISTGPLSDYNKLKFTLAHELVHAGGYAGKAPSAASQAFGAQDLDYLGDKIKAINKECGEAATPQ
jgi:hypothetical protein